MMYLSRGDYTIAKEDGLYRISHCGRIYVMGARAAFLWQAARKVPQKVPADKARLIQKLEECGLVVTTEDDDDLSDYRLLTQCILCPHDPDCLPEKVSDTAKRLWTWICGAGLRLTADELTCLEENGVQPTPALLGETGRQYLTGIIYCPDRMQDGTLTGLMERAVKRSETTQALLELLQADCLLLL